MHLCWGLEDPQRFAVPDGTAAFLRAASIAGVPRHEAWLEASPAGPLHSYPGDDTWCERPFTDGVVLLDDAAGHNNPLIGQGLALALRDVRGLSERLLEGDHWNAALLSNYGSERAERLRRMRFVARLEAVANVTFGHEGRELRDAIGQRQERDQVFLAPVLAQFTGPDTLPVEATTADFARAYLDPRI